MIKSEEKKIWETHIMRKNIVKGKAWDKVYVTDFRNNSPVFTLFKRPNSLFYSLTIRREEKFWKLYIYKLGGNIREITICGADDPRFPVFGDQFTETFLCQDIATFEKAIEKIKIEKL
jgi:hypothetical protein